MVFSTVKWQLIIYTSLILFLLPKGVLYLSLLLLLAQNVMIVRHNEINFAGQEGNHRTNCHDCDRCFTYLELLSIFHSIMCGYS